MNIILFGAPGAGKGTQGELLEKRFDLVRISTGELLRDALRRRTQLGLEAKKFMDDGELVPDEVILGMVREVMAVEANGFIFDGFPRTSAQAAGLDRLLAELDAPLDAVIVLEVDDDVIVRRLGGRLSCPNCGAVYNRYSDPPEQENHCDRCGHELVQRSDDKEETVRRRLAVYREQTAPLIDYYRVAGTPIHTLNGDQSVDAVQSELVSRLMHDSAA